MSAKQECKIAYDSFDRNRNFSKTVKNCVWDIDIELPEPPADYRKIINYGNEKAKRKFPYYTRDFVKEIDLLPNTDPKKKKFLDEEWRRRREGLWFYNGDNLEWVTGHHYMTLQYWLIPIEDLDGALGNPKFFDMGRDRFYAIWWAKKHPDHTGLCYIGGRRSGKALDINTPIPTPSGFKLMKDIDIGDKVYGANGKPLKVTTATEVKLNRIVNRVWFDDDTYLDADDEHQWEVTTKKDRKKHGTEKAPVRVMNTKELKEQGIFWGKTKERNFHIKINDPVEYKEQDLPIDPYLLGYWLGDGKSYNTTLHTGKEDLPHIKDFLDKLNINHKTKKDKLAYTVSVLGGGKKKNSQGQFIADEDSLHYNLNTLNLLKTKKEDGITKHIPDIYKMSSIHQRQELVRGLMDSDGHIAASKLRIHLENTQKSKRLAEDLAEVLRSLGTKVRVSPKKATMRRENGSVYEAEVYRVNFLSSFNPFKLERKAALWRPFKNARRKIKSIEKIEQIESIPVKCISVEGDRRVYLAGRHYTVTHNTADGLSAGYWDTTERENALFGVQSKTDTDSKQCLLKLVKSWQQLPEFLKPVDTGYTSVSRELMFAEPQRRSTKGGRKEYKKVLNSRIYAYPSTETAMDGTRTTFQFQDEFGKRVDSKADRTQKISKICCMIGRRIVGFAFWATTVEEMEKAGGEAAKVIWDESDPNALNENGRTKSTMVRLFFPAEYGLFEGGFVDEWGYSDIEAAAQWLDSEERGLDGDALLDWKRKFPRDIGDAFATPMNANSYNQRKLYEQTKYNASLEPVAQPTRGNFYWSGGMAGSAVEFAPDPDGRWLVSWMPPEDDRNRKEYHGGNWRPTRDFCKTGADPFAHRATTETGSLGAAYTILESHYSFPKMKMAWVCEYRYRRKHPHQQAEDIMMQCIFYSSPLLAEKNVYGLLDTINKMGYDGYCMFNPLDPDSDEKRRKGHRGMPMTGADAGEALCNITQAHIEDHIGWNKEEGRAGHCPFPDLIKDWQKFEPDNRTKYDSAMAAGMALIATKKARKAVEKSFTSPSAWVPNWNNSGNVSSKMIG